MSPPGLARPLDGAGRRRKDLIERALVCLIALAAGAASLWVAPGLRGVLGALLALVMLAISVIDARQFIIPDALSATAFGLALVSAATADRDTALAGVELAVLRAAVLGACFLALRAIYQRIRGRQGICSATSARRRGGCLAGMDYDPDRHRDRGARGDRRHRDPAVGAPPPATRRRAAAVRLVPGAGDLARLAARSDAARRLIQPQALLVEVTLDGQARPKANRRPKPPAA